MKKNMLKNLNIILTLLLFFPSSSQSSQKVEPEITIEMGRKVKTLVQLYQESFYLAEDNFTTAAAQKHIQNLLGCSRKWLWNSSGTIEKLWNSTTPYHFKWQTVEEKKGGLGALENRKARFLWEDEKQKVLDLHAVTVANLSKAFTKLKLKNSPLCDLLFADPYQKHNYDTFLKHARELNNETQGSFHDSPTRKSVRKAKANERRQRYSRLQSR